MSTSPVDTTTLEEGMKEQTLYIPFVAMEVEIGALPDLCETNLGTWKDPDPLDSVPLEAVFWREPRENPAKNVPEPMEEPEKDPLENFMPPDVSVVIGQIDEILIPVETVAQENSPIESMDLEKNSNEVKGSETQSGTPGEQEKRLTLEIAEVIVSNGELGEEITTPENEAIVIESVDAVEGLKEECEAQGLKNSDEGREEAYTGTIPKNSLPRVSIPFKRIQWPLTPPSTPRNCKMAVGIPDLYRLELIKEKRNQDKRKERSKVRPRRQFEWDDYYSNVPEWEESLKSEAITPQHPLHDDLRGKIEKKKQEKAKIESRKGLKETQVKKTRTTEDREKGKKKREEAEREKRAGEK